MGQRGLEIYFVVDAPGAAEIASLLDADPELEARVVDGAEAPSLLRAARAALVIEVGQGGVPAYRLDPSRPESRAARPMVDEALQRARGRSDAFTPSVARVTEPGSRYIDFLIPGLIGVSLMQGGLWGVGYVLVDLLVRKLLKRFPPRRLVVMGLVSSTSAYFLWGAASQGWMMYAIIFANLLGFTVTASVQSLVSAAADAKNQGQTLGSVSSLNSLTAVIAPVLASPALMAVSHLPQGDWRIGAPLYFGAALQFTALLLAWLHFRSTR
jgi:hypothetical protein